MQDGDLIGAAPIQRIGKRPAGMLRPRLGAKLISPQFSTRPRPFQIPGIFYLMNRFKGECAGQRRG